MLSKSSALLLGIIAERPINPYEITKLMEYISVGNWLSLAPSSIYATIKTLQDKGYIAGKNIKDGNMPEKTVYSITAKGKEQLITAIEGFLGNMEWNYAKSNVATIFICHISKDKALAILNEKVNKLAKKIAELQTVSKVLSATIPPTGLHSIRHMTYLTNAEIQSCQELISIVEADEAWNHFLAKDRQSESKN